MRIRKLLSSGAAVSVMVLVAAACTVGSGNMTTESRDVSDFDEIVLLGSGDVTLEVTGIESLQIEAEDNIMPLLTSEVVNGRLELGADGSITTARGITYTITASELVGVTVRGSGDVDGSSIDADLFQVAVEGSGNVKLTGISSSIAVRVAGSGNFDGRDFESDTGEVTIDGSGSARVNVTDVLEVTVNGSGSVKYEGDPDLRQTINGSGSVSRG